MLYTGAQKTLNGAVLVLPAEQWRVVRYGYGRRYNDTQVEEVNALSNQTATHCVGGALRHGARMACYVMVASALCLLPSPSFLVALLRSADVYFSRLIDAMLAMLLARRCRR